MEPVCSYETLEHLTTGAKTKKKPVIRYLLVKKFSCVLRASTMP
jgi:hypothetical protein